MPPLDLFVCPSDSQVIPALELCILLAFSLHGNPQEKLQLSLHCLLVTHDTGVSSKEQVQQILHYLLIEVRSQASEMLSR